MSQSFRFEQVFTPDVHDALWDWAQTSYGASDDWCILYLNGLPLGRLEPVMARTPRARLDRQTVDPFRRLNWKPTAGLRWATVCKCWRNNGASAVGSKVGAVKVRHLRPVGPMPLCALERAAFRPFGLMSQAVHLNGLVETEDGLRFWIGRRSPHKAVDPNKLDNLTGGGISSGEKRLKPSAAKAKKKPAFPLL